MLALRITRNKSSAVAEMGDRE